MATYITGKLSVPVFYRGRKYEVILKAVCTRNRFLKSIQNIIPNLSEEIIILKRYERWTAKSADKLKLEGGSEILLLDPDKVEHLDALQPVSSRVLLSGDSERLSVSKALINSEGAYFDRNPPNLTLQALADAHYYLPQDMLQRLRTEYGAQALPNARVLPDGHTVLRISSDLIWTDTLGQEYIDFMQDAFKSFERDSNRDRLTFGKVLYVHQTVRNERHIRSDLYEPLFNLAGLHQRAGISGDQKLSIHSTIAMATTEGRRRFATGLKPDLCDGWLFKHSIDENQNWRLVGPHEKLVEGRTGPMIRGQFGDDKFMGVDLLVELKKEDKDVDKYKVWLEAIGSLLCFNKDFKTEPVIFCGTCSQFVIRFYAVENADEDDKDHLSKPPSKSKQNQADGVVHEYAASPDDVKFVVRNFFSTTIVDIESFYQFAMFLWRMKQFRRKQFDVWVATQAQSDFDFFAPKGPLQIVRGNQGDANVNTRSNTNANTRSNNTNTGTRMNAGEYQAVDNAFGQLNFAALQRLRKNIYMELWCGQMNGVEAYLKANIGVNDVAHELSIYSYLQGKGFVHMPKMLGSYTCEDYEIIVVEKVDGEHVERLPTTRQVTLYAYKLLRVLEVLHALNVAHGDIKPSNILYNRYNRSPQDLSNIKLIDFGFAQVFDEPCKTGIRGYSYGYSSLELVNTNSITLKDDIYSAGIIIGQLICGYTARDFEAHGEITERVQQSRLPFGTEPLGSLVLQMLAPRQERLAASQLLEHQAFKELLDSPFSSDEEMKLD